MNGKEKRNLIGRVIFVLVVIICIFSIMMYFIINEKDDNESENDKIIISINNPIILKYEHYVNYELNMSIHLLQNGQGLLYYEVPELQDGTSKYYAISQNDIENIDDDFEEMDVFANFGNYSVENNDGTQGEIRYFFYWSPNSGYAVGKGISGSYSEISKEAQELFFYIIDLIEYIIEKY